MSSNEHHKVPKKRPRKRLEKSQEGLEGLSKKELEVLKTRDAIWSIVAIGGIVVCGLIFSKGGAIDIVQDIKVKKELKLQGYIQDSDTENYFPPDLYPDIAEHHGDKLVEEIICGNRVKLRKFWGMEDALAIDQCLRERSRGKECMHVTSSFRTNGEEEEISKSGNYVVGSDVIRGHHESGRDWDVTQKTAKLLVEYNCICNPSKAPKRPDGQLVTRCEEHQDIKNTSYHIYPTRSRMQKVGGFFKKLWKKF